MEMQSASQIQFDYMQLLITQLQHQNPLEPMSNEEMASQLAQFSSLSKLESINSSFGEVLAATNRGYANSLIGKEVSYLVGDGLTTGTEKKSDVVNEVYNDVEGDSLLIVGRRNVGLEHIAHSLIGQEVSFLVETSGGGVEVQSGTIRQVSQQDGQTVLLVDGYVLGLEDVSNSLIGREVSYLIETQAGAVETRDGVIEGTYEEDGRKLLVVGRPLRLEDIVSVR